ncbi:YaiO family outer membrane beta-barrel protein [Salmonella enterica]|nr:YaiO family outer membrane beta-barrel protein [Salmonella enterica]EDR1539083.1 YaiO family outer membrane beta-barrel protein [Salmonella enterica subsp. enterica serovar Javiana]EGO3302072.1 YaiO family outer membrane beta-barrel protein [Salmonella enterica]EHC5972837.1 YaiO family outer membrane beta-barrel protein [Salmonella enterica]EIU9581239.1 YaiO family outer membrane beta-barrel protein [Salmonella enterica]
MMSNKHWLMASALSLVFGNAQAEESGIFESSISGANVTAPYDGGKAFKSSALFNLNGKNKFGISYLALDAWGESTNYLNLRYVGYFTPDVWIDSNVGASDKDSITAKFRGNAMINWGIADRGLILGAGIERYTMRSGGGSNAVRSMVVKYLDNIPVSLQLNTTLVQSDMNNRLGGNAATSIQYGYEQQWIVAAGGGYGRVNYELVRQPGSVADYRSTSYFVTGRYWFSPDWGMSTRYSGVTNHYYTRNEIEMGVFVKF